MDQAKTRIYEFADFRLDPCERVLYRAGIPMQVAPKVFDTLLALVVRHGRLVSKEILMKEIWDDCFVEENNLTQYIFTLRKVLGEKNGNGRFIETVPRKGYRFVGDVYVRETTNPGVEAEPLAEQKFVDETRRAGSNRSGTPAKYLAAKDSIGRLFAYASLIIILVASLGFVFRYGWQQNSFARGSRDIRIKRLTESGNLFGAAISSDGKSLAYVVVEGRNHSVRLRNIPTESEIVIAATAGTIISPVFSPDGNFIYYAQAAPGEQSDIYRVPILGGEPARVARNLWSGFSVSPDGREIAFPRSDPAAKKHYIVVAATDGSGERIVAERSDPDYYALWGPTPAWSPDGEHLTVVTGRFGVEENHLVQLSLFGAGEEEIRTRAEWRSVAAVGWAGRDELIVAAQEKNERKEQLWQISLPNGTVERLTNDFHAYVAFNLTQDASRLIALKTVQNIHLWRFDKETGAAQQLTFSEEGMDGFYGLALAPDGQIIFTAQNKGEQDIFSLDPATRETRRLTKNLAGQNYSPAVSPDNRLIAFCSERNGAKRLWVMDRDGSGERQLTPADSDQSNTETLPYFSSDGKWVYYTLFRGSRPAVYKISVEGGEPVAVAQSEQPAGTPAASPDGKFLAFAVYDEKAKQPWQIAVRSLSDGKQRSLYLPAFRHLSRWSRDSRSLISIEQSFNGANLWQTDLETNERRQITNFTAERLYHFDVSRDGRYFVVARGNGYYDAVLIERSN